MCVGKEVIDLNDVFLEGDVLLETIVELFSNANGFFFRFFQICF